MTPERHRQPRPAVIYLQSVPDVRWDLQTQKADRKVGHGLSWRWLRFRTGGLPLLHFPVVSKQEK